MVQQRLREAFAVELRLPDSERPRGLASVWPPSPVYSFTDVLHWTDARERVWRSWARAKGGVFPHEVSRMEEAQGWLLLVEEGERRCLAAWALASARGIPVRKVLRQRGWAPHHVLSEVRRWRGAHCRHPGRARRRGAVNADLRTP